MTVANPQRDTFHIDEITDPRTASDRLLFLIKQLERKSVNYPGNALLRESLGIALMRVGRTDEALPKLESALKIAPTPEFLNNLVIAYWNAKMWDSACSILKEYDYISTDHAFPAAVLAEDYSQDMVTLCARRGHEVFLSPVIESDLPVSQVIRELRSVVQDEITTIIAEPFDDDGENGFEINIRLNAAGNYKELSKRVFSLMAEKYNDDILTRIVPVVWPCEESVEAC